MAQYNLSNLLGGTQQNMTTTFKTVTYAVATTGATTLRRGWIKEVEVGADGAPNAADTTIVYSWDRTTADGTGTSVTPPPLDVTDAAALLTYKANYTVEPTVTANTGLLVLALNQRNSQRVSYEDDKCLVIPAVNLSGIVGRAKSAIFASTVVFNQYMRE